jgi:2-methylcitrate synthase
LHGGANEAAMALIEKFRTPEEAVAGVKEMLARKEKVMGFGHAVYKERDPRNAVNKRWAQRMSVGEKDSFLYDVSVAVEKVMADEKKLFANADFFSASAYHFVGMPTRWPYAAFVSRTSGRCAHIRAQRTTAVRPATTMVRRAGVCS